MNRTPLASRLVAALAAAALTAAGLATLRVDSDRLPAPAADQAAVTPAASAAGSPGADHATG